MLTDQSVYSDFEKSKTLSKELSNLEKKFDLIATVKDDMKNIDEFKKLEDETLLDDIARSILETQKLVDKLYVDTLLSHKYDSCDAIVKLHSGAGGTEACDWVVMVYRMYSMFVDKLGYKLSVIDKIDGDDAGYKSITFKVSGEYAYGYLKGENGVHRLVRISPFDANKRRHTSFLACEVTPVVDNDISVVIDPKDIRIDTYRSSGAGGQHVNTTDSAIRITHIPTGIVVTCQNERSQIQNREGAMSMLKGKLIALKEQEENEKILALKGQEKKIEWGSQIRSYVFCPYTMVKDHRTGWETSNVDAVMDGDIMDFVIAYLKFIKE